MSNIERRPVGALDADERSFELLMRRARLFAHIPGLKKEIQGDAEAVAGIMLSLQGYGLAVTLPSINSSFDWIEGRAEPSALLYQALARHHGYYLEPRIRTAELAVVHVSRPSDPHDVPAQVSFTLDDAVRAHRLDEWVEVWRSHIGDDGRKRNHKIVVTVAVNGQPVADLVDSHGQAVPEAAALRDSGQVKRFDAWWNYRTDMLWKSAAKRAVKIVAPNVLLGGGDFDHDDLHPRRT